MSRGQKRTLQICQTIAQFIVLILKRVQLSRWERSRSCPVFWINLAIAFPQRQAPLERRLCFYYSRKCASRVADNKNSTFENCTSYTIHRHNVIFSSGPSFGKRHWPFILPLCWRHWQWNKLNFRFTGHPGIIRLGILVLKTVQCMLSQNVAQFSPSRVISF